MADLKIIEKRADDQGGAMLEYAVTFVLVAALASTVLGSMPRMSDQISGGIDYVICRAFPSETGLVCEEPAAGGPRLAGTALRDPAYYVPEWCQTNEFSQSSSVRAQAFVYFEGDTVFTRTDMADGSTWFTAEPLSNSVGVGGGFGRRIWAGRNGTSNRHAGIEGGHTWSRGYIWVYENPDKADDFEERVREETSVGRNVWEQLGNPAAGSGLNLPNPHMVFSGHGINRSVNAGLDTGLRIMRQSRPGIDAEMDVGPGIDFEGSGGVMRMTRRNYREDEVIISETHQVAGSLGGNGEVLLGAGGGRSGEWSAGVRQDRTRDGELQGIFLSATVDISTQLGQRMPFGYSSRKGPQDTGQDVSMGTDADRQVQNTYVYVEFEDDEQREIGEQFLRDYRGYPGAFEYFWETMVDEEDAYIEEDPGPDGDPWEQLVYENAQAWQSTSDRDFVDFEYGASFRYWIQFGGNYTDSQYEQTTTDAWYLAAPRDGRREIVEYEECIYDGD